MEKDTPMWRKFWYLIGLFLVVLLAACAPQQRSQTPPTQPLISDSVHVWQRPSPTPPISIPRQVATPTPKPHTSPTSVSDTGAAPYGPPPPMTEEEIQLTQ